MNARSGGLPALTALRGMRGLEASRIPTEVLAGVTLAALMIPLNIGYAQIAGVPPVVGLYAAIVPSIAFALLAHTRHLVAGPDAAIAAMIAGMVGTLAAPGDPRYLDLVLATSVICGVIFAAFWAFRLGFLASFLSHAVLVGFIAGLGIEVLVSQVEKILGLSVEADGFFLELRAMVQALPDASAWSVAIGVGTIAAIVILGRVAPRLPAALIALVAATVAVAAFDLDQRGVSVLGPIDGGMPSIAIPQVTLADLGTLFPIALALCAATLAEAPLIARSYAERYGEDVDADQDMLAFGAANVAAGLTGGLAIGSSASRTAAMASVGARTQLPSLVAGIVVAVILLFFTDLLAALPSAALAGIVAFAVIPLIDVREFRTLWRVRRSEFLIALTAGLSVLVLGVLQGVLIAFVMSLFDLLWRASNPHTAVLVELPGGAGVRRARPGVGERDQARAGDLPVRIPTVLRKRVTVPRRGGGVRRERSDAGPLARDRRVGHRLTSTRAAPAPSSTCWTTSGPAGSWSASPACSRKSAHCWRPTGSPSDWARTGCLQRTAMPSMRSSMRP